MKKGNVRGMIPLIVFPVLYVLVGVISGSFDKMPLMVGISIAIAAALIMDRLSSFDEKIEIFLSWSWRIYISIDGFNIFTCRRILWRCQ